MTDELGARPEPNDDDAESKQAKQACETIGVFIEAQKNIFENIKFIDQKALVITAVDSALLGVVFTQIHSAENAWTIGIGFAICLALIAGIGGGLKVVYPRGHRARTLGYGFVDANRISRYRECSDFIEACRKVRKPQLRDEVCELLFHRSKYSVEKYYWLKWTMIVSLSGWISAIVFAAATKIIGHLHSGWL